MEIADWIGFELPLGGDLALDIRQPRNAVALKAAMQRRTRQMRKRRLKRIEAVVQRQQRVTAEGDNDCLLLNRQNRRSGLFRPRPFIANRRPLLPFGDRLLVNI